MIRPFLCPREITLKDNEALLLDMGQSLGTAVGPMLYGKPAELVGHWKFHYRREKNKSQRKASKVLRFKSLCLLKRCIHLFRFLQIDIISFLSPGRFGLPFCICSTSKQIELLKYSCIAK